MSILYEEVAVGGSHVDAPRQDVVVVGGQTRRERTSLVQDVCEVSRGVSRGVLYYEDGGWQIVRQASHEK
jgi:hypothetical protein